MHIVQLWNHQLSLLGHLLPFIKILQRSPPRCTPDLPFWVLPISIDLLHNHILYDVLLSAPWQLLSFVIPQCHLLSTGNSDHRLSYHIAIASGYHDGLGRHNLRSSVHLHKVPCHLLPSWPRSYALRKTLQKSIGTHSAQASNIASSKILVHFSVQSFGCGYYRTALQLHLSSYTPGFRRHPFERNSGNGIPESDLESLPLEFQKSFGVSKQRGAASCYESILEFVRSRVQEAQGLIETDVLGRRPTSVAIRVPPIACMRILRSGCCAGLAGDACRGVMTEKYRGLEREKGLRGVGKTCLRRTWAIEAVSIRRGRDKKQKTAWEVSRKDGTPHTVKTL